MGCISSKVVVSRSLSFHEELSKRLQRKSNGNHSQEELIMSGNSSSSDQFLALVCTANAITKKLRSGSLVLESDSQPKQSTESVIHETIRTSDDAAAPQSVDVERARRSKSCHGLPAFAASSLVDSSDSCNKGMIRARSFHTVEEFDEMMKRMQHPGGGDDAKNQNSSDLGFKRKAVAKGLQSLKVPEAIEFPAIASFRERVHGMEEVYITPKFGSYSLPNSRTENRTSEDVSFNPEMVAAFEECMQQLKEEEESILRQIVDNLEEEINDKKEVNDKIPSNTLIT